MKALLYIPTVFVLLLSACAHPQRPQLSVPKQVNTEADAIAVVLADIQRRGGDPRREECSAKKFDDYWWVTAWHIIYPRNVGSSRFCPGGFTVYHVSTNASIIGTLPGQ
jgi:hypothetical protein